MSEPVDKSSEQSVVSRALALRAKMASNDLYKKYFFSAEDNKEKSHTQETGFKGWDDWDKGR
jgi:hypothetical protein